MCLCCKPVNFWLSAAQCYNDLYFGNHGQKIANFEPFMLHNKAKNNKY